MDPIEAAYQSTLDYLYSFVDYSLTRSLRYSPEKFNLERMNRLVEMLGSPHTQYPVVHVAGTKGKGSTSALIAGVLQEAGYKVGFYTSPHMIDFTERIQVNRVPVTHAELVKLVEDLKPSVAQIEELTTFELTTAAGFLHFARQKVDIAVIEVGLGGRLDATNVVDPLISVITSLSMDHMNVLGDTLAKIAGEKAGIIKPGKPVVVAPQKQEATEVVERIAAERKSPLTKVDAKYQSVPVRSSLKEQVFEIHGKKGGKVLPVGIEFSLPLLGAHQAQNALTAFAVLEMLQRMGWKIALEDIQHGFSQVKWPGRFEILQNDPLVIIDSAHNLDSAEKLAQTVRDYLPGKPLTLIFGASEDKDVAGMFKVLAPVSHKMIVTQSAHPRSFDSLQLGEIAKAYSPYVMVEPKLETALRKALQETPRDGVVLVTGSIFVAAGIRELMTETVPHSKV